MRNATAADATTDDAFAVTVADVVVDSWSWSMARLGAEKGTKREINQIRVGANLAAAPPPARSP